MIDDGRVSYRDELANVIAHIDPDRAYAVGDIREDSPKERVEAFDALYGRACEAAVRVVLTPTVPRPSRTGFPYAKSSIKAAIARDYANILVAARNRFIRRAWPLYVRKQWSMVNPFPAVAVSSVTYK